jgi:hypothetical protein
VASESLLGAQKLQKLGSLLVLEWVLVLGLLPLVVECSSAPQELKDGSMVA